MSRTPKFAEELRHRLAARRSLNPAQREGTEPSSIPAKSTGWLAGFLGLIEPQRLAARGHMGSCAEPVGLDSSSMTTLASTLTAFHTRAPTSEERNRAEKHEGG